MRSACTPALLLALLFPAMLAAGGPAASADALFPAGSGAGSPGGSDAPVPLFPNISFPERTIAAQAWYERGFALTNEGRYTEAVLAYRNALAADPSHLNAWYYLGDALFRLGRYEEALLAFGNATAADPDFVDAYFSESRVYGKLGMHREEKEALARGLEAADRRSAAGVAETRVTGGAVPQPVSPVIPLLGAGSAAVLLGYRRRPGGP
ncbi:MAG: tetratricopeptide repeat protein [Methanomicrobiales archaeon]|nr:tetratricopeptide repeat protein [Methanomicrobiales archaeon]